MSRSHWGRGDKGKATKLHSLIIRARGECENCGEKDYTKLQCAHIISRRYGHTRTDLENAFCLCAKCHMWFTIQPVEFARFVFDKIGEAKYDELMERSQSRQKLNWKEEADRLTPLWERKRPTASLRVDLLPDLSNDPF